MENFQSWVDLVKKAWPICYWRVFSSLILFLDKIVFHLIMPLIIIRPRHKFPAFPAKAGENLEFSSFSSQLLKQVVIFSFPAFPAFSTGVDTLWIHFGVCRAHKLLTRERTYALKQGSEPTDREPYMTLLMTASGSLAHRKIVYDCILIRYKTWFIKDNACN